MLQLVDPRVIAGAAIAAAGYVVAGVMALIGPGDAVVIAAGIAAIAQIYSARVMHQVARKRRVVVTRPAKDSPTLVLDELMEGDQQEIDDQADGDGS